MFFLLSLQLYQAPNKPCILYFFLVSPVIICRPGYKKGDEDHKLHLLFFKCKEYKVNGIQWNLRESTSKCLEQSHLIDIMDPRIMPPSTGIKTF